MLIFNAVDTAYEQQNGYSDNEKSNKSYTESEAND